jgi:Derlin-2/3
MIKWNYFLMLYFKAAIWGVPMQAMYLPFALLGLNTMLGNPVMDMIHGMVVGHLYYFMVDVVPKVYGKDIIQTPLFIIQKFGIGEYVPPVPTSSRMGAGGSNTFRPGNVNPPRDPAASTASSGHTWGSSGQRLGSN